MKRILMMEGNTLKARTKAAELNVRNAGQVYSDAVKAHFPDLEIDTVNAADEGEVPPHGRALTSYDGLIIGGSGLHAYGQTFAVTNQIKMLEDFAQTGKPILGSCWGLQIAVMAAGGKVELSPNGREIGIARKVELTEAGRAHPFMAGKPNVYDAPCIHYDEVSQLPDNATLLSSNAHSAVQAAIVPVGQSEVWAVQYHPEFDLPQLGMLLRLYEDNMYEQGFLRDRKEFEEYHSLISRLAANPQDKSAAWRLGVDSDITDDTIRRAEIINWVNHVR